MAEALPISNNNDSGAADVEDQKLESIFLAGWQLYEELEVTELPSNGAEYQQKVQTAMKHLERATQIVSQIGLFSSNELIDEVSTDSLQYMLLPYILGKLTTKISAPNNLQVLEVGEVYFNDHLQRCAEYELCEAQKKETAVTATAAAHDCDKPTSNANELRTLMQSAYNRNEKIMQYRKMKELDEYINRFKVAIQNKTVDDEIKRKFFLKFLEKSIMDAKQELQSIIPMKEMVKMRISGGKDITATLPDAPPESYLKKFPCHSHAHDAPKPKPLQPFIITRNATQKAVFGLGYPSLPIMTVDEFYTKRVEDGIFPDDEKVAAMNLQQAIAAAQDPNEKEDEEQAVVEVQIENDDPEYLARMRRMDEYKDVVRRGDGNRYNRS